MNQTSFLTKISLALIAFACLFSASKALSQEAYLGIGGQITTAYPYNQPTYGFLLQNVEYGSPAYYAGLRPGDVLLESNGMALSSHQSMANMRRSLAYGSVRLYLLRHGRVIDIVLGGQPGGGGGGIIPSPPIPTQPIPTPPNVPTVVPSSPQVGYSTHHRGR